MPKFFLTTPIYYVNARPHIGHAYTTIVADVLARHHRLRGDDTWFLTGTDEHGQKIERSAVAAGIEAQAFTDEVSASFRALWDRMGLTYDDFVRTTEPRHKQGVQALWKRLEDRGKIYLSSYTGQYCVSEEIFVEGPPGTIGPDGRPTETVTEENYFFKLSEFQLPLIDLLESGELEVTPEARNNELLSFLRGNTSGDSTEAHSRLGNPYVPGNLRDLSISRSSFKWGIPVSGDEKHVIYVWLDALANYMTAVGYGSDLLEDAAKFEKYWPADLHIVGKEIIRQHCIYWPAFLLAADLPLPKKVVAHGWLLFEESKMSKSKGNIVRTETILDAFGPLCPSPSAGTNATKQEQDLFAADVLRYFLLREIPFGQDGSFSFDALITRYNADLANGYGNLVSRTLNMIGQYCESIVPGSSVEDSRPGQWEVERASTSKFEKNDYSGALQDLWSFLSAVDQAISSEKPWLLAKSPEAEAKSRLENILYRAAESIRILTALLHPILPFATARVWTQLGLGSIEAAAARGELTNLAWGGLKPGTRLGPLSPIFPRADKGLAQTMNEMESAKSEAKPETGGQPSPSKFVDEKFNASPATPQHSTDPGAPPRTSAIDEANPGAHVAGSNAASTEREGTPHHAQAHPSGIFSPSAPAGGPADASPQIAIDDFAKIELRVAQVVVAERIPKADKLLRLEVDLGHERRQILSGIAEWYTPEDLIGRRIIVITNLAPRKMRGLDSHGMLLAATGPEGGKPALATFADADHLPLGSRLR